MKVTLSLGVAQERCRARRLQPVQLPVEDVVKHPLLTRPGGLREAGQGLSQGLQLLGPALVDGLGPL